MTKPKARKRTARKKTAARKKAAEPTVAIAVVPMKIGEGRDNLAQRSKWFAARTGKKS